MEHEILVCEGCNKPEAKRHYFKEYFTKRGIVRLHYCYWCDRKEQLMMHQHCRTVARNSDDECGHLPKPFARESRDGND